MNIKVHHTQTVSFMITKSLHIPAHNCPFSGMTVRYPLGGLIVMANFPFLCCTAKLEMKMYSISIAKVCGKPKATELPPYHPQHLSIEPTPGAMSG